MSTFKIFPIFLGKFTTPVNSMLAMRPGPDRILSFGCLALRNNQTSEVTLLDTGYATQQEINEYDLPWKYYATSDRIYVFEEELANAGIRPDEVKRIGITHLHQDHCWNLQLFKKDTPIYVQKCELERALLPQPIERASYQKLDNPACPAWMRGFMRFVQIDGDYEIEPGLRALSTPGHTVGSQSFLIDTEEGQYIYTGDHHYCEENYDEDALIGWYTSMDDWFASQAKIKATGAKYLGSHTNFTYTKRCYG